MTFLKQRTLETQLKAINMYAMPIGMRSDDKPNPTQSLQYYNAIVRPFVYYAFSDHVALL